MLVRYFIEYEIFKDHNDNKAIKMIVVDYNKSDKKAVERELIFYSPISSNNEIDMKYISFNIDNLTGGSDQIIKEYNNISCFNDLVFNYDKYISSDMININYLFNDKYIYLKLFKEIKREIEKHSHYFIYVTSIRNLNTIDKIIKELKYSYPNMNFKKNINKDQLTIYNMEV